MRANSNAAGVRILLLAVLITCLYRLPTSASAMAAETDVPDVLMYHAHYHFRTTQGKGVAVCDAFLKRLKTAVFQTPPQCGIPEDTAVPGFSTLNRISLTTDKVAELFPRIWGFTAKQIQVDRVPGLASSEATQSLGRTLFAWQYDPPMSIGNDGKPDNIVVWQGPGLFQAVQRKICGQRGMVATTEDIAVSEQVAFVLTRDNRQIDEPQTRELFGRRKNIATGILNGHPIESPEFVPLGMSMGFFKYRDVYYMHTFYDQVHGDLQGKRYNTPSLDHALAVFKRTNGHTKQICEYQMSETPVHE